MHNMGIFDTMLEKVRGKKEQPRKRAADINLPDERKGQIVGSQDFGNISIRDKDNKVWTTRFEKPIYGGDPDDPRWEEHNKRVAGLFPDKKKK